METIAQVLVGTDKALAVEEPNAVLLLGDTNSCLAAIAAKRRQIPILHMEAGNRCFDQRVPEDINRKIVDHVSDINLPYTERARRYLLAEGLRPEMVIKTGSPMREVLEYYRTKIDGSDVLERLGLRPRQYFVVSAHREENVDSVENLVDLGALLFVVRQRGGHSLAVLVDGVHQCGFGAAIDLPGRLCALMLPGAVVETGGSEIERQTGFATEALVIANLPGQFGAADQPEAWDAGQALVEPRLGGEPRRLVLERLDLVTQGEQAAGIDDDHRADPVHVGREMGVALPLRDEGRMLDAHPADLAQGRQPEPGKLAQVVATAEQP